MLISNYNSIICLRPKDESTDFLNPIGGLFGDNYKIVEDTDDSHSYYLDKLRNMEPTSLILFLGHGMSGGLYSAKTNSFEQNLYISSEHSKIFTNQNALLLACRSAQFIRSLSGFKGIIGFGNIISSREEILQELEFSNELIELEENDIELLKSLYVNAFKNALKLFLRNKIVFKELYKYICFFLNKEINYILKSGHAKKLEISKQLFLLRNEMTFKQS